MTTRYEVKGQNYSLSLSGKVNFFGFTGFGCENYEEEGSGEAALGERCLGNCSWIMGEPGVLGKPEKPSPVSGEILSIINTNIKAGKARQLTELRVAPRAAVQLFLEGVIQPKHLKLAQEKNDTVLIPDVVFSTKDGQRILDVIVVSPQAVV